VGVEVSLNYTRRGVYGVSEIWERGPGYHFVFISVWHVDIDHINNTVVILVF
jgi:hypothetical protein